MNENSYRRFKSFAISISVIGGLFLSYTYMEKQSIKDNEFFCDGAPVTIKEGDTLYWIAREHCEGNTMNVVEKLVKLYGTILTIGDTISLPTHPSCELRITDGGQVIEECE
jgi:hypothetical protein